jgi:ABC-type sugar transport system substrate-binding protein
VLFRFQSCSPLAAFIRQRYNGVLALQISQRDTKPSYEEEVVYKTKYLRALLPILILAAMTWACGTSLAPTPTPAPTDTPTPTNTPAPTPANTPTPEAPEPTAAEKVWTYEDMVVGFLQTGPEDSWRAANTASFIETAARLGITLKFHDSQNDLARQVAGFRQFNEDPEVNVIVLAALEPTGWNELLQETKDAGKIVILEDRRIDAPEDLYATYVGSDFVEEGRKAAVEMCRLLEGSEKKNVWELVGDVGSSAATDRGKGFRETMDKCGIIITESQTAGWSAAEGKMVMEDWLGKSTDVQGVFAHNDEMALGAIEALKEAGLEPGSDIKIVSVDATRPAFDAMLAGELNVTVECNPDIAPQAYEAALKALNGEELPKWIPTREGVFSSDMPNLQEIADGRMY